MADSTGIVSLPSGVKVGAGHETSQINAQGQIDQGMVFPVTLKDGSATNVFVPYSDFGDTAKIKTVFDDRIKAIMDITG